MKSDRMDVVDLLSDESFINYCKKTSAEDVAFWEDYGRNNPERQLLVETAKAEYIHLFNALAMADLDEQVLQLSNKLNKIESPVVQMEQMEVKKPVRVLSFLKISIAVAAVLAVVLASVKYNNYRKNQNSKLFMAANGERKNIQLPDGSVVTLNGGSKIEIAESFGISTRDLYLEGEAFFDVKHNKQLPFIVHTPAMDVKALGTAFNVKAYPGEKITETSLVRGLVEVTLKENNNQVMLLHPNQKIHWEKPAKDEAGNSSAAKKADHSTLPDSLMKKLVATDAGIIKEIAWKENKLIFEDESLENIAVLLERWYAVKIIIKDEAIRNYRFTGLYEREELSTVLNLLKEARNFNYDIEPGETIKVNLYK